MRANQPHYTIDSNCMFFLFAVHSFRNVSQFFNLLVIWVGRLGRCTSALALRSGGVWGSGTRGPVSFYDPVVWVCLWIMFACLRTLAWIIYWSFYIDVYASVLCLTASVRKSAHLTNVKWNNNNNSKKARYARRNKPNQQYLHFYLSVHL